MEVPILQLQTHLTHRILVLTNFSEAVVLRRNIMSTTQTPKLRPNYAISENGTWAGDLIYNITNASDYDYEFQIFNHTTITTNSESWTACKEWTPAQHPLFQTANFFFAAAFLVPTTFKQSVLIVRALLTIGYLFLTVWGGVEVCAPDIFLWNALLVLLNIIHTVLLTWRFLPATLTLELTELYDKLFKPLKVSRKHFKELTKEAKVMTLAKGDIYAVEDVSPADERLSILLKGRLRVTCDDTHLHFINTHQFVDSPEWESNHEQSDDVFQVTITAEEDTVFLSWPRMKLERVLRHRPMLKVVFDAIIGKDITQKLYALNEHLSGLNDERKRGRRNLMWAKAHRRSLSMDAVNTGTTGLIRSQAYKSNLKTNAFCAMDTRKLQAQCWVPLIASQFPASSPFNNVQKANSRIPEVHVLTKTKSVKKNREVKFESPK